MINSCTSYFILYHKTCMTKPPDVFHNENIQLLIDNRNRFEVFFKQFSMQKLLNIKFYKDHWFQIAVVLIISLATFLRFYNYENRWSLAGDPARDAIIAKYALENNKVPSTGPFSSAGNFTTGNIWYVWLIASAGIYSASFLTPWI